MKQSFADGSLPPIDARRALDAIEIADRVWWVGHYQEGDPFQCHVYLLEHGDRSVLFDPGSTLTFEHTLRKIAQVTPFSNIRYFVCHHQDPDITGALPAIDAMIDRDDAVIVTHWRAEALLRHYGTRTPFWRVEGHDWTLDLGGRVLRFVFTPYAHFPGAFTTFDEATGTLFSSDIFGGFTEGFSLVAQDEGYFESIRPFHEHYMPSRDILQHTLSKLEVLPIRLIAPQHGSIIPGPLVRFMIDKLKGLECGLYLLADKDTDIKRLSALNRVLRDITQTMVIYRDFQDIAAALLDIARRLLPAESLEFFTRCSDHASMLRLSPETRFRGTIGEKPPPHVEVVLRLDRKTWSELHPAGYTFALPREDGAGKPELLIPLFSPSQGRVQAVCLIRLSKPVTPTEEISEMIEQMAVPLQVAVERETIYRTLDMERQQFYQTSIRDPLTGLFTRFYMHDTVKRLFGIHERDPNAAVGVAMVDVDHFKSVNDTYGHNQGDVVLKRVAEVLLDTVREADLAVRLGGEEFAVFVVGESAYKVAGLAERLRQGVAGLTFDGPLAERRITASFGTAVRRQGESLEAFLERADMALYEAKNTGRDRVCCAS